MNRTNQKVKGEEYPDLTEKHHHRMYVLTMGYAAFLFAFFLGIASAADKVPNAGFVMGLILVSLPALVSFALIDFIVRVRQRRPHSAIRGLAALCGFGPSFVALSAFIWPFAPWASVVFGLSLLFWFLLVSEVAGAKPGSKI